MGNPARRVADIDVLFAFRETRQLDEAYALAMSYYDTFGTKPHEDVLNEYFRLFCPRSEAAVSEKCRSQMRVCGNFDLCMESFLSSEPEFTDYDAFWDWCLERREKEQQCQE